MKTINDETMEKQALAISTLKKEMGEAMSELRELKKSYESLGASNQRLDQSVSELEAEKAKLRQRIIQLKKSKRVAEVNTKFCKNCSKEFVEAENFNWSCRTHRY